MAVASWLVFGLGLWQVRHYFKMNLECAQNQKIDLASFNSSSNAFFVMSFGPFYAANSSFHNGCRFLFE